MLYSSIAPIILLLTSASALAVSSPSVHPRAPAAATFGIEYVFSAKLTLGSASSRIPIYGGFTITETIPKGTVTGPYINATIEGGQAFANVYKNGTLQEPLIEVYGTTSDGLPFQVHETGLGSNQAQMTRIVVNVGGDQYEKLVDGFILASVNPNEDRTIVSVEAYLITNTAQ